MKKSILLKYILVIPFLFAAGNLYSQRDAIYKKDSTQIRCKILSKSDKKYSYAFADSSNKVSKSSIAKIAVDSIVYNRYDSDLVVHKLFGNTKPAVVEENEAQKKPLQFSFSAGFNLGNVLEFNSPSGSDTRNFSATCGIDLGMDYLKDSSRFVMTNELHWTVSVQKSTLNGASHIQRATDDITTLHDFSYAFAKNNKWNANLIVKANTSTFTIFDGNYFKDYNNNGKIQAFLSPYDVTLSPGIKFQPDKYLRVSLSPYSINMYGLQSQEIANTGFYTETMDAHGNYDRYVFKQLGAELNIWYDRKIKKWLEMQYRLSLSSDYFSKIASNGLMNGLFITKVKLIKNVYLTHRATLKADFAMKPFKPYYSQTILLSYSIN